MTIRLRQSTASQEIPLGILVDESTCLARTNLTIAAADILLWKMGASSLVAKNSGGATHMSGGVYVATLDATDTGTLGSLVAFVHISGALPFRLECEVLTAAHYDALVAGSGTLDVNVTAMAANTVTAAALATDAVSEIQSGLATGSALSTVGGYIDTEVAALTTNLATANASLVTIDGIVDDILADTAVIGATGGGLTSLASAGNLATVASYVDTEVGALTSNLATANAALTTANDALTAIAATIADILADTAEIGAAGAGLTSLATQASLAAAAARLPAALVGGRIDANVGAVNGQAVEGAGTEAEPWGPA